MRTRSGNEPTSEAEWKRRTLSVDVIFETLADEHRREALSYLLEQGSAVTVEDLVDRVASSADAGRVDGLRRRIRTRLHHNHLPKLSDLGAVEYRPESEVVEPGPTIQRFEPYLAWASGLETE